VVEDDFIISMELDSILEDAGAEVVGPCRSVAQASALIDQDRIAAAILDFRLGQDTSLPVAQQLTRRGIPFVFFTGQANTNQIHAEWPGAKIIAKPFQRRTIVAAVADMVG
jgi:DNA-binding NtrC family response regulator